jgi:hypothetical protein
MTTSLTNFTLYLSSEGDSVEIKNFEKDGATLPEQQKALACKTHEQVLAFLETLRNVEVRKQINFFHIHNTSYIGHLGTWPKGAAHPCDLETQIDFVRYKIGENTHGVRQPPKSYCIIQ